MDTHTLFYIKDVEHMPEVDKRVLIRLPDGREITKEEFSKLSSDDQWDILWHSFYLTQLAISQTNESLSNKLKSLEKRLDNLHIAG